MGFLLIAGKYVYDAQLGGDFNRRQYYLEPPLTPSFVVVYGGITNGQKSSGKSKETESLADF